MYDIENIKNINDLIEFLQNLACDYEKNKDEWQNCSINAYIEAAKVAKMFYMGKIYE